MDLANRYRKLRTVTLNRVLPLRSAGVAHAESHSVCAWACRNTAPLKVDLECNANGKTAHHGNL